MTNPQAVEALKPCPFCGNDEPEFERMGTPRQSCIVVCGNCGARHESSDEGARSGSSWNDRATQPAPQPEAQALPPEWTPEMSRAVQLYSELGAYAASSLSGAYGLFEEFWNVAHRSAVSSPAPAPTVKESLTVRCVPAPLTDEQIDALIPDATIKGMGGGFKFYTADDLRWFARAIERAHKIGLDGGM